jgi:cytochrome c biogenesis protein CcmG/thiol:disulfide interchange protein DsbE
MRPRTALATIVTCFLLVSLSSTCALAQEQPLSREESKWLDRLPREDGEAARRSMGWAAPEFPDSTRWRDSEGPSLESLRGKVVLVQTFTTRGAGRSAAGKMSRSIAPLADEDDFVAIAVHTPEDLDRIDALLPAMKLEVPVLIDEKGAWCDSVGAFRRPVAYLIDRQGNVRYAGVSARSVEDAARKLLAEPYDASTPPRVREDKPVTQEKVDFPTFTNALPYSADQRGREAPAFYIEDMWREPVGDASGKVVVLDFWATWCGPCRAAIPHMNEMQEHYGNEVICLGISDENNFELEMRKRGLKSSDFKYGLAVDRTETLKKFFGVRGIPHVAVLSGDWVVRWQGSPTSLNQGILDSIVQANQKLMNQSATEENDAPPPARWVGWLIKQSK